MVVNFFELKIISYLKNYEDYIVLELCDEKANIWLIDRTDKKNV